MKMKKNIQRSAAITCIAAMAGTPALTLADIAATHIYHNHMPNFWPYYNVDNYAGAAVGSPIRYMYDGQVLNLKNAPPQDYDYYLPNGAPMPHDDLQSYYSHHAKVGAYQYWPMDTTNNNAGSHPQSQTQVTMSASVINNVQSFAELGNLSGYNLGWGDYWRNTQQNTKTVNGYNALDTIHFSGHHSMGPLVGNDYFLKDLIYQNVTLAQPYFLGDSFKSSTGFFPTELGFSERIIPVLTKLGIEWSVLGNVHYSRTLKDYPYLNDPGKDTMVSPPNRADLQNESNIGDWVSLQMFNEQQVTHNKFPFASIPHWVQYIDPETGEAHKVAGIPVEQASSWEEGYQGSVTAAPLKAFEDEAAALNRRQYFVVAHDGDNSSGRAGDGGTWNNSGAVTYSDAGVTGVGVQEYLAAHPIPADDIVHVQDGSWIDTRDSSADPTWYHWHLPFGIWSGQFADFNRVHGTDLAPLQNYQGVENGMTVSLEYGYHYLERNFALQQAAENYAKTAEQIWLDSHPDYWSPSTALDHEVTYPGNQLNPWMMSYPVKGDANNDYAGGANPAELGWYFLIAAIDSGFGYYDENTDDHVKPTISFNQSLYFTEPYVQANLANDRTGPSMWWPQRYPYNPGSANKSKAEGWNVQYYSNDFAVYTYAYDVSDIANIELKVRTHASNVADPKDATYQVYDPAALAAQGVANIDPARVSDWATYPMAMRDLDPDINGVAWQTTHQAVTDQVPAQKIGDLYYAYLGDYREQLLDYYIEATDSKGNVTRSDIQQVYVGAGQFKADANGKIVEDVNGDIDGVYPFITAGDMPTRAPVVKIDASATKVLVGSQVTLDASASYDPDGTITTWAWNTGASDQILNLTMDTLGTFEYTLTLTDNDEQSSSKSVTIEVVSELPKLSVYPTMNFRGTPNAWIAEPMSLVDDYVWKLANVVFIGSADDRYKFDVSGDWATNFGDTNADGTCEQGGGDIFEPTNAVFDVYFNDQTKACWRVLVDGPDQAPNAVLTASATSIDLGQTVTLDASGSTDPEGTALSYAWSFNSDSTATTTFTPTAAGTYTLSVTVTDGATLSDSASVELTVTDPNQKVSTYPTMYFRGTANDWAADPMSLVSDYLWKIDNISFSGSATDRFKFDVYGDWTLNFGDTGADGIADQTGTDIYVPVAGIYSITLNDLTKVITITKTGGVNLAPVANIVMSPAQPNIGDTVTFGASSSTDDSGITSYQWSNGMSGAVISVVYNVAGAQTMSVTVSDEPGLTATDSVSFTVVDPTAFESSYPTMQFRGTANDWSSSAMSLVADYVWSISVDFAGASNDRFKFDVNGDWSTNFGDNNSDGYADANGGDIYITQGAGTYVITFNDVSKQYTVSKQ